MTLNSTCFRPLAGYMFFNLAAYAIKGIEFDENVSVPLRGICFLIASSAAR